MNVKWLFHPCRRHAADLSLLAAGALADAERAGLERHLEQCPGCRARLVELKNLAGRLTQDGQDLPQVEPPSSLRRRWMTEVRQAEQALPQTEASIFPLNLGALASRRRVASVRFPHAGGTPALPGLTGRRLAWGGIAAMWTLILFFRFSAPDAPRPQVMATPPTSLRQILLALRTDLSEPSFSVPAEPRPPTKLSVPDTLPPRSQRPAMPSTKNQRSHEYTLA
jgi:anti-sigma factor RsiW